MGENFLVHQNGFGPTIRQNSVITFTAPPKKEIELQLDGDTDQRLRIFYHMTYQHEATFTVGKARVTGRSYAMYFRPPHVMP